VNTTDKDHDGPYFLNPVRNRLVDGPNQLWVHRDRYWDGTNGIRFLPK
jgi:hypothetical protein